MSQAKSWIPAMLAFVTSLSIGGCVPPSQAPLALRQAPVQAEVDDPSAALIRWQREMHAKLGISTEQRAQLQAVFMKHLGDFPTEQLAGSLERLRSATLQPTMDQAAARSAWDEIMNSVRGVTPRLAEIAEEARPILTPEQRRQAIALAPEASEQFKKLSDPLRDQGFAKMAVGLDLTPAQAQGWAELKALDKTLDDAWLDKMTAAKVRFFEDGDSAALVASLQGALTDTGREETLAWTSTLSQAQRQRLVQNTVDYMDSLKPLLKAWLTLSTD